MKHPTKLRPAREDAVNEYLYEREIHLEFDPEEEKATLQRFIILGTTSGRIGRERLERFN